MALQVAASSTPLSGSFRSPWKAARVFWKLLPKVPSISPPEKCARSSRTWARTTAAPLAPSARSFCVGLFTAAGSTAAIVPCSTTAENAKLTQRDIIRRSEGTPKAVVDRTPGLSLRLRRSLGRATPGFLRPEPVHHGLFAGRMLHRSAIPGQIQAEQPVGWFLFETKLSLARAGEPVVAQNREKSRDSEARQNGGAGHGALERLALAHGAPHYPTEDDVNPEPESDMEIRSS